MTVSIPTDRSTEPSLAVRRAMAQIARATAGLPAPSPIRSTPYTAPKAPQRHFVPDNVRKTNLAKPDRFVRKISHGALTHPTPVEFLQQHADWLGELMSKAGGDCPAWLRGIDAWALAEAQSRLMGSLPQADWVAA